MPTVLHFNFFQTELDSLESERGELRNKLKETAKKALLEGISSRVGILVILNFVHLKSNLALLNIECHN